MVNRNKQKGSQTEREVVAYLNDHGFPLAERRYGAGAQADKGDINGLEMVVEVKNLATITLASIMDETETEIANSHFDTGMAVIKRRGKGIEHAYAVMTLARMAKLLKEAGY